MQAFCKFLTKWKRFSRKNSCRKTKQKYDHMALLLERSWLLTQVRLLGQIEEIWTRTLPLSLTHSTIERQRRTKGEQKYEKGWGRERRGWWLSVSTNQTDLALFTENRADDKGWKEKICKRTNGTNEEFALSSFLPLSIHSPICLSMALSPRKGRKGREREWERKWVREWAREKGKKERGSAREGGPTVRLFLNNTALGQMLFVYRAMCIVCYLSLFCLCHVCVGLCLSMGERVATLEKCFSTMNQPLFSQKKALLAPSHCPVRTKWFWMFCASPQTTAKTQHPFSRQQVLSATKHGIHTILTALSNTLVHLF